MASFFQDEGVYRTIESIAERLAFLPSPSRSYSRLALVGISSVAPDRLSEPVVAVEVGRLRMGGHQRTFYFSDTMSPFAHFGYGHSRRKSSRRAGRTGSPDSDSGSLFGR